VVPVHLVLFFSSSTVLHRVQDEAATKFTGAREDEAEAGRGERCWRRSAYGREEQRDGRASKHYASSDELLQETDAGPLTSRGRGGDEPVGRREEGGRRT
jgi:hypothetical protein